MKETELTPREKQILEMRRRGMTFEQIGAQFAVTRHRIWSIHQRALKKQEKK